MVTKFPESGKVTIGIANSYQQLSEDLTFYEIRHVVKPGVTGWAQVKTDYGASVEDSLRKLQYDLYYIKHRSFFLDLNIIVKTLSTVLFYRGR